MSTYPITSGIFEKMLSISGVTSTQGRKQTLFIKYKDIVDRAPDGMLIIQDGFLKYANARALSILGWPEEECLDTPVSLHLAADNGCHAALEFLSQERHSGQTLVKTVILKRKDGSRHKVEINASWIQSGLKKVCLVIFREICQRHHAEEQLEIAMKKLRQSMNAAINAMSMTLETRDPYTSGHQKRVAELATAVAAEMNCSPEDVECIRLAASVHDLGKIAIPAEILSKPGRISEVEFRLIQNHPQVGYDILKTIDSPCPIADIVLQHHERVNGSGYPNGMKGDDIHPLARILAVADVVEAMVSHRPYRSARTMGEAIHEISKNRGVLYDQAVVDASRRLLIERCFNFKS